MIAKATFCGFKSLANLSIPLGRLTCLVGANGSGKTSVLEALHHLCRLGVRQAGEEESSLGRVAAIFDGRHAPARVITAGGQDTIKLGIDGDVALTMTIHLPKDEDQSVTAEVELTSASTETVSSSATEDLRKAKELWKALSQSRIGSAVRLRLDLEKLREASYSQEEVPRMRFDGGGLASVLAYHKGLADDETLKRIEGELKTIVRPAGRIQTLPARVLLDESVDRPRSVSGVRLELEWSGRGFIPADLLSEGTLLVLAFLTVIHTEKPRLLLIDDIERGLHPAAQRALVSCLRGLIDRHPEVQIVCTTHSPFVLDQLEPSDVRVLHLDQSGATQCRQLTAHADWAQWAGSLKPGEFWSHVGEEWVFGE